MKRAPRVHVFAFKTDQVHARAIRELARRDGRSTSSFLHFFLSRALDSETVDA